MKLIRVLMLRSCDQLQEGQSYNLSERLAEELIRRGTAIGPDEPTGPTEAKPAGPSEIKAPEVTVKKNSKRGPTAKKS
jgi:hypothetical protein